MDEETAAACIEIFRNVAGPTNPRDGGSLSNAQILSDPIDSFDIDSLTIMEYIMAVEDRFNVELDEQAVNRCANIAELVTLVSVARRV